MSEQDDLAHAIEAIIAGHLAKGSSAAEITQSIILLLSNWTAEEPE